MERKIVHRFGPPAFLVCTSGLGHAPIFYRLPCAPQAGLGLPEAVAMHPLLLAHTPLPAVLVCALYN